MNRHTHLGVYGVIIQDKEILLIKKARGPHTGKWDFPGGRIEFGEEPYEALQREIEEETGIHDFHGRIRTAGSYVMVHNYKKELEELHHIGIIYDVEIPNRNITIKLDGDGEDSLGTRWMKIDGLTSDEVTPLVKIVLII